MERATGIEPVLPAWECDSGILYLQHLHKCLGNCMCILCMLCFEQLYLHFIAGHLRDKHMLHSTRSRTTALSPRPQNLLVALATWTAEPYRVKTRTRRRVLR